MFTFDDILVAVETESGLRELVHGIINALELRARQIDTNSEFHRGEQHARLMNAAVLHIALDGFTTTEEAVVALKSDETLETPPVHPEGEVEAITKPGTPLTDIFTDGFPDGETVVTGSGPEVSQ